MIPDTKRPGKLLDRQLRGVSQEEDASFMEKDMSLFALESDLVSKILNRDSTRLTSSERTCRLDDPYGTDRATIGGFNFWRDPEIGSLVHESENLTISVAVATFWSDAEEILLCIGEQQDLLARIAPTHVFIGFEGFPEPALESSEKEMISMGRCRPSEGRVVFPGNRSGGLLLPGMAFATKDDEYPVSTRQVVVHEFTHAFQRNVQVQEKLSPLTETLFQYAQAGFSQTGETARSLSEYCDSISPGYMPARMKEWRESKDRKSLKAAGDMASEFWTELCAAVQLGNTKPFSTVTLPMPVLESLREFIANDYESLIAVHLKSGGSQAKRRGVVDSLPPPDFSDVREESIGSRIAYKLESPGRSGR